MPQEIDGPNLKEVLNSEAVTTSKYGTGTSSGWDEKIGGYTAVYGLKNTSASACLAFRQCNRPLLGLLGALFFAAAHFKDLKDLAGVALGILPKTPWTWAALGVFECSWLTLRDGERLLRVLAAILGVLRAGACLR